LDHPALSLQVAQVEVRPRTSVHDAHGDVDNLLRALNPLLSANQYRILICIKIEVTTQYHTFHYSRIGGIVGDCRAALGRRWQANFSSITNAICYEMAIYHY